jgi:hypothetical protein
MPPRAEDRSDQPIRTAQGAAGHPAATAGHDAHRAFWEREHIVRERERIARSPRAAGHAAGHPASGAGADAAGQEARWASWEKQHATLERLHALRSMAPGAILLAAALPFLIAVAKEMAMAEEGAAFASLQSRMAGIGLAVACAGLLALLARRATTRVGLALLVLGAYLGGIAGLAVARGLAGP